MIRFRPAMTYRPGRRVIIVILMDRTGILNIPHCKESRIEALINDCAARDDLGATYSAKCTKRTGLNWMKVLLIKKKHSFFV